MLLIMIGIPSAVLCHRLCYSNRGIGGRVIQLVGFSLLVPSIVILALQGHIDGGTVGNLFSVIGGFLAGLYQKDGT